MHLRCCLVAVLALFTFVGLSAAVGVVIDHLSEEDLKRTVDSNELVLAAYFPDKCETNECQTVEELLPVVAEAAITPGLKIVVVVGAELASKVQVDTSPRVVLYRRTIPILYDRVVADAEELLTWIDGNLLSFVRRLDDASLEHETQAATGATTGDWLVRFYKPECDDLVAVWESVASSLHGRVNVAVVDVTTSPALQKRFDIHKCPEIILLRHGKLYLYELPVNTTQSFITFAESWFKNAPSKPVPKEPTPFDLLVEQIVAWLKMQLADESSSSLALSAVVIATCLLVAAILFCLCLRAGQKRPKRD